LTSNEYIPGPGTSSIGFVFVLDDPKVDFPLYDLALIVDLSKSLRITYCPGPKLLSAFPPKLLPSFTPKLPPYIFCLLLVTL